MHKETEIINIGESKSLFNQHDFSNQQDTPFAGFFFFLNFKSSLLLSLISTWLHPPPKKTQNKTGIQTLYSKPFINRWLDQADQSRSGWQKNLQFSNNYGKCSNPFWEDCQYPTLSIQLWLLQYLFCPSTCKMSLPNTTCESQRSCAGWLSLLSPWTNLWKKGMVRYWSSVSFWS